MKQVSLLYRFLETLSCSCQRRYFELPSGYLGCYIFHLICLFSSFIFYEAPSTSMWHKTLYRALPRLPKEGSSKVMCSRFTIELIGLEIWLSESITSLEIPAVFMDLMAVISARLNIGTCPLPLVIVLLAPSIVPGTQWLNQHFLKLNWDWLWGGHVLSLSVYVYCSPSQPVPYHSAMFEGVRVKCHTYSENMWSQSHWHWTCSSAACAWPHSSGVETGWCAP